MKSQRLLLILSMLSLASMIYAQDDAATAQKVNEQLWKPFKAALEARDWQSFNALHTDDVMRVGSWGIRIGEEYRESIRQNYSREDDRKRTIDFCMEHRIYSGNAGYEVGYYHITSKAPGEEVKNYYARFHVRLRREDGQWKIALDWDTDEINGVPVTAEDFAKGTPLKL